jgi:2,3-bisphosphoglycerate-independent phosphoglycerate mutase
MQKGLLIILDGLGDRPSPALGGATPLEAANTPHLDALASAGLCGLVDPLIPGVPVGTHTGTGILLGLVPADARRLARGAIEAAGLGLLVEQGDVTLRCNFSTLVADGGGLRIVDRRAGRIRHGTDQLAAALNHIPLQNGITATLHPATEHRAVLRLAGLGLTGAITNTDPGFDGVSARVLLSQPLGVDDPDGVRTARAVNSFVREAFQRLVNHPVNVYRQAQGLPPANGIITRGAGMVQTARNVLHHFGVKAALVAAERTVIGLGRLFHFTVINEKGFTGACDTDLNGKIRAAIGALDSHDLVFLHIKGPDLCAHDLDPLGKKAFLEAVDKALMPLLGRDLAIAVSGDHSTDSNTGGHCGDPVPSLLFAPLGRRDAATAFGENTCMQGGLGRITGASLLLTLLDHMGCLHNFRPTDSEILST